jgi:hypothetical protein
MSKRFGRNYAITMLVCLILAVGIYALRGGLAVVEWEVQAALWCDAFFIPAAVMLCIAALMFVSNDGLFDIISYGIQKALRLVLSEKKQAEYPKTFYDYKKAKWDNAKAPVAHLVAAGLTLMALAVMFLMFSGTV